MFPRSKPVKPATKHLRPSTVRRQQQPPKPFIEQCHSPDCTGATTDVDTVHIMAVDCTPCHKRRERDMRWHLEREWWFRSHGYGEKLGPKFAKQCWKYNRRAACAWDKMWRNMTKDAFTKKGTPMYGAMMAEQMRIVDGYWRRFMTRMRKKFPEEKAALGEQGKKRKRGSGDDEDEDDSDDSDDDEDDEDYDLDDEDDWYKSDTELNNPRPKQRRRLPSPLAGSNTDGSGGDERGQRRKRAGPRKMGRRGFNEDYGADPDDDYHADANDTDSDYDTDVSTDDDIYKSDTDSFLDLRPKGWGVRQKRKRAARRKMGRPKDDDGGEASSEDTGYDTELPDLRPTQRQRRSSSSLSGSDTDACGGGQKRKRAAPRKMGRPGPDNDDGNDGYNYDTEVLGEDGGYDTELPDLRPRQRQRRSSSSRAGSDTDGRGGETRGGGNGSRSSTD